MRPLSNKDYQKQIASQLSLFLVANDFPHTIEDDFLTNPTTKQFLDIVEFLMKQADPSFTLPKVKPEDTLLTISKYLAYPYSFQKNWLCPLGAPNTWPHLIGFLSYLLEYAQYFVAMKEVAMKKDIGRVDYRTMEKVADEAIANGKTIVDVMGRR